VHHIFCHSTLSTKVSNVVVALHDFTNDQDETLFTAAYMKSHFPSICRKGFNSFAVGGFIEALSSSLACAETGASSRPVAPLSTPSESHFNDRDSFLDRSIVKRWRLVIEGDAQRI
jgi:hypothetical protein